MRELVIISALLLAVSIYLNNYVLFLLGAATAVSAAILAAPERTAPEEFWKKIAEGSWLNVQLMLEGLPPAAKAYYIPSGYAPRPVAVVGTPRKIDKLSFKVGESFIFIPPGSALAEYCRDVITDDPADSVATCLSKTRLAKKIAVTPTPTGLKIELKTADLFYAGTVAEYVFGSWAASVAAAIAAEATKKPAVVAEEKKEGDRRVITIQLL